MQFDQKRLHDRKSRVATKESFVNVCYLIEADPAVKFESIAVKDHTARRTR